MREGTRNRLAFAVLVCLGFLQTAAPGPVRPISGGDRANLAGAGGSFTPAITPNGRFVVFVSHANNLPSFADTNQTTDIFARDLQANVTFLVSVNVAGGGSGSGTSESPAVSADGRFIAFVSTAGDLVPGATNGFANIYVRDLRAN